MSQKNQISKIVFDKALKIRAIITDVDGVLSNGSIVYDDSGRELKYFNVKDGLIVKHLQNSGILVGVITGRDSKVVRKRCEELGMDFHLHGAKNKLAELDPILRKHALDFSEVAYLGDDLNDLQVLNRCGLSVCPKDAPEYIKKSVDFVTRKKGGSGVFREVADYILRVQGKLDQIITESGK